MTERQENEGTLWPPPRLDPEQEPVEPWAREPREDERETEREWPWKGRELWR